MSTINDSIIAFAELHVGLVGSQLAEVCGLRDSAWERELYRPFRFIDGRTTGVSTCGLVAEGFWYGAGIEIPSDWRPYKPGKEREKSIARAVGFGSKHEALRVFDPDDGSLPEPGDYVIIGEGYRTHALTCVSCDEETLESIDGGQVDAKSGLQTIKRRSRKLSRVGNRIFATGSVGDKRLLAFWISVAQLPNGGA